MASQEPEFVGNDRFVLGAVVDIEVVDSRVHAQLAVRSTPRRLDRRRGLGHLIAFGDADQPRAMQRGGVPDRAIGRPEQPGCRASVAPA
jgi:hypothetical protein